MGAQSSAQRDGKSKEDATTSASASASAGDLSAEVRVLREEGSVLDSKQKNGQISSMTSLNGHSEDNTLAEVGQPDGVSVAQKEEAPETMGTIQDEVVPQVNGEKVEKESTDANDISAIEEKAADEKPNDASEVGFKKIFRFVGFRFTLKKDKNDEKEPVKLVLVKDKEDKEEEEVSRTDEPTKEEEAVDAQEQGTAEESDADTVAPTVEAEVAKDSSEKAETTDAPAEATAAEATDEAVKEEGAEKEVEAAQPPQDTTMSPFKKLFIAGIFSTLRKKASIKKTKEEEEKEAAVDGETAKTEETAAAGEEKKEKAEAEQDIKEEEGPATPEREKSEPKEDAPVTPGETKSEPEVTVEAPAPIEATNNETKQEEAKAEGRAEEEKTPAEVTSEAELLSSQEKAKPQGSPLKKLFTGAGLKKLSTKKQRNKKDTESKLTESGEQGADQLQSSTESAEVPQGDSGPSSPEESGEHVIAVEVTQNGSSNETEGEVVSDGEKKKDGIVAWSSFKKLVTPKKIAKRSSESEDEATGEKPAKSATLSPSEGAALADNSVEEEAKEEKQTDDDPKTENAEKLLSSTEESKKKLDTSVSWEALMCMGGTKKRTRRTSDSEDEETKVEDEAGEASAAATAVEGEQEGKTEVDTVSPPNPEVVVEVVSSPEPVTTPPERESAWDTLKRLVLSKNKAKVEEKPEESADQVQSDIDAQKDESTFSLRKLFPGRRKKKIEKPASTEAEEDSDTPAVVPLSEYDKPVEPEQEVPTEPAAVQARVSAEDRAPSWIPASVEDSDDKHDQLSDIPEEVENAATPKSVDTDTAEDEAEDQAMLPPRALGRMGRRLSTAEVKPVAPAPAAETTPVPHGPKLESAKEIVGGIEAQISEIPTQTSVTVEDVPLQVASEKIEYEPPTEKAESNRNTILERHTRDEAMAICTGLGTKEIAKVALEKPVTPLTECVAVVRDALSTEVSVVEKPPGPEEATFGEDALLNAQVLQVETTELEPVVGNSLSEIADIQAATVSYEPEIEKVGLVSTVVEESEVVRATTLTENSPKTVVVSPITPSAETAVCTQGTEVSEPTVESKEVNMNMQQLAATSENTPLKEVVQLMSQEVSSSVCEAAKTAITEDTEPAIPVVIPTVEVPVITEKVDVVNLLSTKSDKGKNASEPGGHTSTQVKETNKAGSAAEASTMGRTSATASKKMEEIQDDVQHPSSVAAQSAVKDDKEEVSKDKSKPKKFTIPKPVQAIATTEKEIEITTETPVITNAPVTVMCEKPVPKIPQALHVAMEVIDTIPIEITESLDDSDEEEKKPEVELKKAVEVKVSEDIVVLEEVIEEELEEVNEEQSKEEAKVQEHDVKEVTEEVKPQSEETKPDAPSEENKEKMLEIHMPVQVVLQTAQVVEEQAVEEEAVEEFGSNGPMAGGTRIKAKSPAAAKRHPTLTEETQVTAAGEASAPSQSTGAGSRPGKEKTSSGKCAEVMAQVIEVIEEAVKEIEPVSTEITNAS